MSEVDSSIVSGAVDQPLLEMTIGDALRKAAARFPDNDALVSVFQNQRISYSNLDREADRVAYALLSMGIQTGDRVAIWSANRAEWLIAHHGAVRIGAIVVTVNPALRKEEATFVLHDSGAKIVFASRAFRGFSFADVLEEARAKLPELHEIVYFDDGATGINWSDFLIFGPLSLR